MYPATGPGPAWGAPPVYLRPLGVGERIDAAFKLWSRNFLSMAKAMLVIAVPAGLVEALISLSTEPSTTTNQLGSSTVTTPTGDSAAVLGGTAIELVLGLLISALAIATLFRIIANAYLGQPVDWRSALRAGLTRMLSALWISVIIALVAVVVVAVVVLLIVVAARGASPGLAVLVGFVLGVPAVGFLIWFTVGARLATPVLMLENVRGTAAVRRGLRLVRGTWWSVFGTLFLMDILVGIASGVLTAIFGVVIVAGHGDPVTTVIADFFLRTITLVVLTPLTASLYMVLTIDMRVRKEGFDIQLLSERMGTAAGPGALSFIRPPGAYGQPGGYPPPPGAYGQSPQPEPPSPPPFAFPQQTPPPQAPTPTQAPTQAPPPTPPRPAAVPSLPLPAAPPPPPPPPASGESTPPPA